MVACFGHLDIHFQIGCLLVLGAKKRAGYIDKLGPDAGQFGCLFQLLISPALKLFAGWCKVVHARINSVLLLAASIQMTLENFLQPDVVCHVTGGFTGLWKCGSA